MDTDITQSLACGLDASMFKAPLPLSHALPRQSALEQMLERELFQSSPDCIKLLRLDGAIEKISPGGQLALELDDPHQLDGVNWPSLWPGSERAGVEDAVAEGRQGKRSQFLAFCPTTKATPRWWDVAITPMLDAGHAVTGLLVVSRDVTELVQAKEALARANAQKEAFMAILSHELRNPLSALAMAAKVLESSHGDVPQLSKISDLIQRQVGYMGRLTEDLLDVSRLTRGQIDLRLDEIDLRGVVGDAAEQLAPMLSAKRQTMHMHFPPLPVQVTGDRMRLVQVLGNLVANASRYSPAEGPIEVTVALAGGQATIAVSDQGKGIAAGMMPTLFDMYSQGQASGERTATGIGVGLGIVKGLVELHGGSVSAFSDGVGKGSTFTIALPLAARGQAGAPAPAVAR